MQVVVHGFGSNLVINGDVILPVSTGSSPQPLMANMIILALPMKQEVYETNDNIPIVGSRAVRLNQTEHNIQGFMHDRRRWESQDDNSTRQTSTLYDGARSSREGTLDKYWQSGIGTGEDCEYIDLYAQDACTWLPRINHGDYFVNWKPYFLWSEQSIIVPQSSETNSLGGDSDDVEPVELTYKKKPNSPLLATIFRRNGNLAAERFWHADYVTEFTGPANPATRERDDVVPGDDPDEPFYDGEPMDMERFNNYEILYREVDGSPYAFLNQPMNLVVGEQDVWELSNGHNFPTTDSIAKQRVAYAMEQLGQGDDDLDSQAYFTRFFPIYSLGQEDPEDSRPKVVTNDGTTLIQWHLADENNLANHSDTEFVFEVDWDYGIIKFARNSADAVLFLDEAVSPGSTTLLVDNAALMPASGRVQIGSEEIQYTAKDGNLLGGLIRGVNSTTATSHSKGDKITPLQCGRGVASDELLSISYVATARIEYEPEFFVDWMIADKTNVHPLLNPSSNGIVYIGREPLEVDELLLEIDKPSLGGGVYGPLAVGSDSAILTATALTSVGTPIPGLTITIDQLNDPFIGLLNGAPEEYTALSNQDGEISAGFTVGNDLSLVGEFGVNTTVNSGKTYITVDGDFQGQDLSQVLLFAVTKDDPALGTVGVFAEANSYALDTTFPGVQSKVEVGNIIPDGLDPGSISGLPMSTRYPDGQFDGGTIEVGDGGPTTFTANVLFWRGGTAYLDAPLTGIGAPIMCLLDSPQWEDWDDTTLNGKKKVIYEYDPTAVHPVTGDAGAYFPVQPSSVMASGNQTIFEFDFELPIPAPDEVENNLGGYWLSLDAELSFQAYADSILTGKRVTSNTVRLRISLPDYLKGVVLENSSQIPYGFKFASTSSSASSGLGGSTFVTINPISGSYLALSNPFASISFLLSVP